MTDALCAATTASSPFDTTITAIAAPRWLVHHNRSAVNIDAIVAAPLTTMHSGFGRPDGAEHVQAAQARHPEVAQRGVGLHLGQRCERFVSVIAAQHLESEFAGKTFHDAQHGGFVIDDEQAGGRCWSMPWYRRGRSRLRYSRDNDYIMNAV